MKNLWLILLIALTTAANAHTSCNQIHDPNELLLAKWKAVVTDPNDPNELLRANWDVVIRALQNKDINQKTKEKIIDMNVSGIFDFTLMSKLALGRTHWPKLTQPQCEKFTRLFAKRLKDSYREKITMYTDEKACFGRPLQKKQRVSIPVQLISNDKKIDMTYKLRKTEKSWKIYDVEIQGVSIILTYRSQFNDILAKGTVEDVFFQLENPPTP